MLLSDKFSHGCKLLLGFHVPSSARAGTACTHNPIFPAKMTKLLNEMISRSICLFLGGEKRCPFLKKTLWLDLHLDQIAANIKCRQCCASSQLPALLEKVNHQGGIEQHVFPYAEGSFPSQKVRLSEQKWRVINSREIQKVNAFSLSSCHSLSSRPTPV